MAAIRPLSRHRCRWQCKGQRQQRVDRAADRLSVALGQYPFGYNAARTRSRFPDLGVGESDEIECGQPGEMHFDGDERRVEPGERLERGARARILLVGPFMNSVMSKCPACRKDVEPGATR